jgi:uncharacterized protein YecT (DUF1311 family)
MRLPAMLLCPVCVTSLAAAALAGQEGPPVDCSAPRNTYENNICADRDFQAADVRLNKIYQRVLGHIRDNGTEKPYDSASWEAAMKASQRAWVAFRDADCMGVVPMEWSGGTGTSAAVLGCMTEKTEARIKEFAIRYGLR